MSSAACGVLRSTALAALLLAACSPPGPGDGGSPTCLAFDQVQSPVVLPTGAPHPIPLTSTLRTSTRFCVDAHTFGLARLDAAGKGTVTLAPDGGMSIRTELGGVYALVDEAKPAEAVSRPLFFARKATAPTWTWPRVCEEVRPLTGPVWACDGALFDGGAALAGVAAARWLPTRDGGVLAARSDGLHLTGPSELGPDAGLRLAAAVGIDGWSVDETGVSFATDAGFFECRWGQPGCDSLGPRFGTGDVPLAQQSLVALMRRDGRTLFSVSPAQHPFCEASLTVQSCSPDFVGPLVAARGDVAWGLSTAFTAGAGLGVVGLAWDGGWTPTAAAFTGPPDFIVQAGVRAFTPARVIYARDRQLLFWRWDATGEAFTLVEVADAGANPPVGGAGDGYFWVSTNGASPQTMVFVDP